MKVSIFSKTLSTVQLLIVFLVLPLLAWRVAAGPYRLGFADHIALTQEEQSHYRGGAWTDGQLCTTPSGTMEKGSSNCNKSNTSCDQNDSFCEKEKQAVDCADQKSYDAPLECVTRDTKYQCDSDTSLAMVNCYKIWNCKCVKGLLNWNCEKQSGSEKQEDVYPCKQRKKPGG